MIVTLKRAGCVYGLCAMKLPVPDGTVIQAPPQVAEQDHSVTTLPAQVGTIK